MKEEKTFAFCNDCGEKLVLPTMAEPIQLTREVAAEVEVQRRTAEQRSRFEQAIFRVQAYVADQKIPPPECFLTDCRDESAYFTIAFDLILSLYQLPPNHPAVADLRESLRGPDAPGGGLQRKAHRV